MAKVVIYIGDARTVPVNVILKTTGLAPDLSGNKIRATIGNATGVKVTKDASGIAGGSSAQVEVVAPAATSGRILVKLLEVDTLLLSPAGLWTLEVVYEDATGEHTIGQETIETKARQTAAIP